MKDMQEQIVGLWAWQKSKYTVIVNRTNGAAMHACMEACRPGSCNASERDHYIGGLDISYFIIIIYSFWLTI